MSDLISRDSVKKAINEYFKMIIDNTDDDVDCVLDYNKNLCDTTDEIPVAYDVDKVVAKLENQIKRNITSCADTEENNLMLHDRNFGIHQAIEIVKRGGKNE